jgi:hypothetical protein
MNSISFGGFEILRLHLNIQRLICNASRMKIISFYNHLGIKAIKSFRKRLKHQPCRQKSQTILKVRLKLFMGGHISANPYKI